MYTELVIECDLTVLSEEGNARVKQLERSGVGP